MLRKSRFDNSSQLSQFFTLDLGGEWGAFIETAKELAELVFNPETSGAGVDMDRNKELLKSFRIPFYRLRQSPDIVGLNRETKMNCITRNNPSLSQS